MSDLGLHLVPGVPFFTTAEHGLDSGESFSVTERPLPAGWHCSSATAVWTTISSGRALPDSGWKVHVSTVPDEAEEVLALVAQACFDLGVTFKHLTSARALALLSGKYAPRTSSGKFITIFPVDPAETDAVVARLQVVLAGRRGPGILTDIAIDGAPVHVRHGAFHERWTVLPSGLDALAHPGPAGDLVADSRSLRFSVPEGVEVPRCVTEALAARRRRAEDRTIPYAVQAALHVSAAGGVYRASTSDGRAVAVKEGRRHAGIGLDGSDAAERLRHEFETLSELSDVPGIARVVDWHEFEDRVFLVQELVPGCRGIEFVAQFHPGTRVDATAADLTRYAARVRGLVGRIAVSLAALHRRGIAFGDLHPGNLLIDTDDAVTLIDFETAQPLADAITDSHTVAPGFRVRATSPEHADRLRLDLIHLWFLTPENTYWEFSEESLGRRIAAARSRYGLPQSTFASLEPGAAPFTPATDWGDVAPLDAVPSLADLIARSEQTLLSFPVSDRRRSPLPVGPGAVPWSLAKGAAGAIWTVRHTASPRLGELVAWLEEASLSSVRRIPGLFEGYAGVAAVLHDCGAEAAAQTLLDRALDLSSEVTNPDLRHGLAGVGLAALRLGQASVAADLATRIAELLDSGETPGPGLGSGGSGISLFATRLFEATGDEQWLDLAQEGLRRDRSHLVGRPDGTALLDHGRGKHLPNVIDGTLGLTLAARALDRHRSVDGAADLEAAAARVCRAEAWATQGLLDGRAGAVALAAGLGDPAGRAIARRQVAAQLDYFCRIDGQVHFPGFLGLRHSCDLESGLAGALHSLRVFAGRTEYPVPLLGVIDHPHSNAPSESSERTTCHV